MYHIDWTSWPILVILAGSVLHYAWNDILDWLENRFVNSKNNDAGYDEVVSIHPSIGKNLMREQYARTTDYENARRSFGLKRRYFNRFVGVAMLACCVYPYAFSWMMSIRIMSEYPVLAIFCGYAAISIMLEFLSIPWSMYDTLVFEEKFGFNTQTVRGFFSDMWKEEAVSACTLAVNLGLAFYGIKLLTSFVNVASVWFVISAVLASACFSLFYESVWINIIAPIFNKFSPLENKNLEKKITDLITSAGFSVSGIYVMDAGKRSRHGNAYFCGWGSCKRIVLYDTLLSAHTEDEIMAILGHETGHLVHHDMVKSRVEDAVRTSVSVLIAVTLITKPEFYHAFGFSFVGADNIADWYVVGFCLSGLVLGSLSWVLTPVSAWMSRKAEYAADAYAKQIGYGSAQQEALVKLYANNLSGFHDHPLYEAWYFSHPGIKNRMKALD